VAVGAESIAQTSEYGGKNQQYHCTSKERLPEMGRKKEGNGRNKSLKRKG
jgi:hypothetical protein